MKRYDLRSCKVESVRKLSLSFNGLRGSDEKKEYIIYEGDLISFLYTENMADVGKNDKIVRGKLVGIVERNISTPRQRTPFGMGSINCIWKDIVSLFLTKDDTPEVDFDYISLVIDESTTCDAKIRKYKLSGIIDINPVDHEYPEDAPSTEDTSSGLKVYAITRK